MTSSRKAVSPAAHLAFALLCILAGAPPLIRARTGAMRPEFAPPAPVRARGPADARPYLRDEFVEAEAFTQSAHSPAVIELGDGDLMAVWYAGTEEGAGDVALYRADWDRRSGRWSTPCMLTDIAGTQADLGRFVRKIGNAVLHRDGGGSILLFYVSVSAGGWSGAALNVKVSDNEGRDWSPARRLVTSPIFNMGTLVRCGAVRYRDGSIGLPVYHELFGKFGTLLRLDPGGAVLDEARISWGCGSLQPSVVPLDGSRAVAFLRQSGMPERRILRSRSADGGLSWSPIETVPLPNPDSAVSALRADDGTLWLACNTLEYDRDTLGLARSRDGGEHWEEVYEFARTGEEQGALGVSYPFMIEASDGIFHMLYSWNRERIRHVRFNRAWLEAL